MDIYHLFTTIVELGSFNKAAEKLGTTQPTVSKKIDKLEAQLDTHLFRRSTRHLMLTSAGEQFYERSKEIINLVDLTEKEVRRVASDDDNILRIATSASIADAFLPDVLSELKKRHPDASFRLEVDATTPEYYQREFQLKYDLFIRQGEGAESNMSSRRLANIPLRYYASPGYLEEFGHPEDIDDLQSNHRFVGTRMNRSNRWVEKMSAPAEHYQIEHTLLTNHSTSLVSHAEAGLGVILAPEHLVKKAVARETLLKLDVDVDIAPMPVSALYRREYITPLARECLDLLIDRMAEYL
ncbi:hypothetical protein EOPP23_07440 [Endozoicomonas sp. OPT23]|uniref:LysR family transcriptional regulator n=1 Tax=Endozoicomonas sp. OPT23 TaxID=2072845 RepID=UPI00129AE219|nr:LysR family transcriptional regulator [Endozoicomonas sp. OPT23]MRI32816.1 hypothetical protein [Endozoicomonas sp. OPT23]